HWGFDDPAKVEGTDEEKWARFQRVRDEIGVRIRRFVETEDTCDHRNLAGLDYLKEDLEPPWTKEITMIQAFAEVVEKSDDEVKDFRSVDKFWYSVKKLDPINGEKLNCYRASLASLSIALWVKPKTLIDRFSNPFKSLFSSVENTVSHTARE